MALEVYNDGEKWHTSVNRLGKLQKIVSEVTMDKSNVKSKVFDDLSIINYPLDQLISIRIYEDSLVFQFTQGRQIVFNSLESIMLLIELLRKWVTLLEAALETTDDVMAKLRTP